MPKSKVKIDTKNFDKLIAKLKGKQIKVKVGVVDNAKHPKGISMTKLAQIMHFGTRDGKIPARPFVTDAIKRREAELTKLLAKLCKGIVEGKIDPSQAAALLGLWAQNAIRRDIVNGKHYVKNAIATLAKKKSRKPLIDSGIFLGSIKWIEV
jgi:hypothetical protein